MPWLVSKGAPKCALGAAGGIAGAPGLPKEEAGSAAAGARPGRLRKRIKTQRARRAQEDEGIRLEDGRGSCLRAALLFIFMQKSSGGSAQVSHGQRMKGEFDLMMAGRHFDPAKQDIGAQDRFFLSVHAHFPSRIIKVVQDDHARMIGRHVDLHGIIGVMGDGRLGLR